MQITNTKTVMEQLMSPVNTVFSQCLNRRECKELPDMQWLEMGVSRAITDNLSGRAFLQDWMMNHDENTAVGVSHFFETLKSARRLKLIEEVNVGVAQHMPSHPDGAFDSLDDLSKVEVYAGDGHYHGASAHEEKIDGKKRAVGHFYTLNLRTHGLTHLAASEQEGGRKKHEHDMHALKRTSTTALRQGAGKGTQVLYVWDCAGIDLKQWHKWKQAGGVYFLSRSKSLIKFTVHQNLEYDAQDAVNQNILSDEQVTSATCEFAFRRIRYQCPASGQTYEFITNHMNIRPGVLAWLYMRRWDIEKTYDTFKNKLGESKAWARSPIAKAMQAQFMCLAHNLMVLLESLTSKSQEIINEKEIQRCQKRILSEKEQSSDGSGRSPLYYNPAKRSQLTLKFIRWLRHHLHGTTLLQTALQSLRMVYLRF